MIFPEGGRSPDGWGQPFRGGAAYLALRCTVPVVPVHIEGTGRILRKGKRRPARSPTRLTFGDPLWPGEGEDSRRFAVRIERAVAALADEVGTDWYSARLRAHAPRRRRCPDRKRPRGAARGPSATAARSAAVPQQRRWPDLALTRLRTSGRRGRYSDDGAPTFDELFDEAEAARGHRPVGARELDDELRPVRGKDVLAHQDRLPRDVLGDPLARQHREPRASPRAAPHPPSTRAGSGDRLRRSPELDLEQLVERRLLDVVERKVAGRAARCTTPSRGRTACRPPA